MQYKEIKPNVFHITFKTQEELARAFLPFQEYYENIHFARKAFTLEEFKDWYTEKFGSFSYYEDWSGFNVPGFVFEQFDNLRLQELVSSSLDSSILYEIFHQMSSERSSFYVIGTTEDTDPSTLAHELAHARYYLDDIYHETVVELLQGYDTVLNPLKEHLKSISYHNSVILDECHAYVLTEEKYLTEKGLFTPLLADLRKKIKERIW